MKKKTKHGAGWVEKSIIAAAEVSFFPSKQEEIRWRQRRDRGLRGWVQPTRFYSAANADVMRANVQKVNKDIKGRGWVVPCEILQLT